MCGIAAILSLKGPAQARDLERMLAALRHRGPDDAGFAALSAGKLLLGHVRLSVIDLNGGQQPIHNEDQTLSVVCNGELYDHVRIRQELIGLGHRFTTQSDSEIILHLYEEYGLGLFEHLNGEFAFVLWDGRARRLLCARDRFGIKPLFYAERADELLLASEAKGILALARVERELSNQYLGGACLGAFPADASAFRGVKALKPGHYLLVDEQGAAREAAYFEPTYSTDLSVTFEAAREGVRELFTRAVKRRMVADVPVGVYLSGGLDSTLVCGQMAKASGARVTAFNLAFRGTAYDESGLAQRIAQHYGVDFASVDCTLETIADHFLQTVEHVEGAFANPHAVAKLVLSKFAHDSGFKVAITGEGADEVFGGYPFFKLERLWGRALERGERDQEYRKSYQKFCADEARSEGVLWYRGANYRDPEKYLGYPCYAQVRAEDNDRRAALIFAWSALGASDDDLPGTVFRRTVNEQQLRTLHPFNATRRVSLNQLAAYILPMLGDRVEMASSMECRTPFLDPELYAFASRLPPEYFLAMPDMREKHVLREAFRDDLPPFMHSERKHPFLAPNWWQLARTMRGRELFEGLLSDEAVRQRGVFRPATIRLLKLAWRTLPASSPTFRRVDVLLGMALCVQALHLKFVERRPGSEQRLTLRDRTPTPSAALHALGRA